MAPNAFMDTITLVWNRLGKQDPWFREAFPVEKRVASVFKAATRGVLWKKVFLEISQNSQENTGARVSLNFWSEACNFIKKDTLAQVLSCYPVNTFFTEHL